MNFFAVIYYALLMCIYGLGVPLFGIINLILPIENYESEGKLVCGILTIGLFATVIWKLI
jgi:hypothetical protein